MHHIQQQRPILVTGAHRSGTTWLATMLALAPNTLLVHEPFNIYKNNYALGGLAHYWFTYAAGLHQEAAIRAFDKVLQRRVGKVFRRRNLKRYFPFLRRGRLIIKDPIACFSSEWLADNFDLDVIVIIRHPAAFAASLVRMNWTFDFKHLLSQKQLIEDQLSQNVDEIINASNSTIDQAGIIWKVIYSILYNYCQRHHDWQLVKHEDISLDPLNCFQEIYSRIGLSWTSKVKNEIVRYTDIKNPVAPVTNSVHTLQRNSKANVYRWKQLLDHNEVQRLKEITQPLASKFYSDEYW